jgi:asparagine synthase (glutamine-hydrolysing)
LTTREAAAEVAALYPNMRHVLVESSGTSFLDILDHNNNLYDHPCFGPSNEVWSNAIMARAREAGITVLLNGNCGNSTLSYEGMPALSVWFRSGHWGTLARVAWQLHKRAAPRALDRSPRSVAVAAVLAAQHDRSAHARLLARLQPAASRDRPAPRPGAQTPSRPQPDSPDGRTMLRTLLEYGDVSETPIASQGGWQLDFRDPTYDRRVVEFCLTVPLEEFLRGGQMRSLARRAMVGRIAASTLQPDQARPSIRGLVREPGGGAGPDGGGSGAVAELSAGEPHA